MLVAIHQPNFFPWLGYFAKIALCDCFVFLDNVQLSRQSYCTRVQVRHASQARWLSVPLDRKKSLFQPITAAEIIRLEEDPWPQSLMRQLEAWYGMAPYASEVMRWLDVAFSRPISRLSDLNVHLVRALAADLALKPRFIRASELSVKGASTDLLVDIVKNVGGTGYLRGTGASAYQEDEKFVAVGITPFQLAFEPQAYKQIGEGFVAGLSVLDALFNCGFDGTADQIRKAAVLS